MQQQAASSVKQRSGAIDAVRVIGVLAVITGHVLVGTGPTNDAIYVWHMPLFFILSGYFWSTGRSMRTELGKRTRTLAYPYIGWFLILSVPYLLAMVLADRGEVEEWGAAAYGGTEATSPYTTFWFISVLFFAALLMRILERFPRWAQWSVAGLGLLAAYANGPLLAQTPFSVGSAVPTLVFLLIGFHARGMVERAHYKLPLGLALAGGGALLAFTGVVAPFDIKYGDWGTPVLSVVVASAISVGMIMGSQAIFKHHPAAVSTVATALASTCLAAVLAHSLVTWALSQLGWEPNRWVEFALATAVPWTIGLMFWRTRFSSWINGSPQKVGIVDKSERAPVPVGQRG